MTTAHNLDNLEDFCPKDKKHAAKARHLYKKDLQPRRGLGEHLTDEEHLYLLAALLTVDEDFDWTLTDEDDWALRDIFAEATELVGKTVRCWDFERDSGNIYAPHVKGRVVAITDPATHPQFRDCHRYVIAVTEERWARPGVRRTQAEPGRVIFAPINGTPWSEVAEVVEGLWTPTALGKRVQNVQPQEA